MTPPLPPRTPDDDAYGDIDPAQIPLKELKAWLHTAVFKGAAVSASGFLDAFLVRTSGTDQSDELQDLWLQSLRRHQPYLAHRLLPHVKHPVERWMQEALGSPRLLEDMLALCPHTTAELTAALVACLRGVGTDPHGPERAESFAVLRARGGCPRTALAAALRAEGAKIQGRMPAASAERSSLFDNALAWMTPEETEPFHDTFRSWTWLHPNQQAALLEHTLPRSPPDRPRVRL